MVPFTELCFLVVKEVRKHMCPESGRAIQLPSIPHTPSAQGRRNWIRPDPAALPLEKFHNASATRINLPRYQFRHPATA